MKKGGTMKDENESLESQVKRLADFIMQEVPGEPSQAEGAIDTAIRLLKEYVRLLKLKS